MIPNESTYLLFIYIILVRGRDGDKPLIRANNYKLTYFIYENLFFMIIFLLGLYLASVFFMTFIRFFN